MLLVNYFSLGHVHNFRFKEWNRVSCIFIFFGLWNTIFLGLFSSLCLGLDLTLKMPDKMHRWVVRSIMCFIVYRKKVQIILNWQIFDFLCPWAYRRKDGDGENEFCKKLWVNCLLVMQWLSHCHFWKSEFCDSSMTSFINTII